MTAGGYPAGGEGEVRWASADTGTNPVAIWALVLGIVAGVLTISGIGTVFAWIPGLAALILGIIGVVKARKLNGEGRRMGFCITGIVLGALSLIVSVIFAIFVGIGIAMFQNSGALDCFDKPTEEAQQACIEKTMQDGVQPEKH